MSSEFLLSTNKLDSNSRPQSPLDSESGYETEDEKQPGDSLAESAISGELADDSEDVENAASANEKKADGENVYELVRTLMDARLVQTSTEHKRDAVLVDRASRDDHSTDGASQISAEDSEDGVLVERPSNRDEGAVYSLRTRSESGQQATTSARNFKDSDNADRSTTGALDGDEVAVHADSNDRTTPDSEENEEQEDGKSPETRMSIHREPEFLWPKLTFTQGAFDYKTIDRQGTNGENTGHPSHPSSKNGQDGSMIASQQDVDRSAGLSTQTSSADDRGALTKTPQSDVGNIAESQSRTRPQSVNENESPVEEDDSQGWATVIVLWLVVVFCALLMAWHSENEAAKASAAAVGSELQSGVEEGLVNEPAGQEAIEESLVDHQGGIEEWLADGATEVVRFAFCSGDGSGCKRNAVQLFGIDCSC